VTRHRCPSLLELDRVTAVQVLRLP
jgi:hypothetical protein